MTVLNLFRGQAIGAKVDVIGSDCIITLDLEDYNRLPPLVAVGAPAGGIGIIQADGTVIYTDVRAQTSGIAAALAEFPTGYWPPNGLPTLDLVTGFLATDIAPTVPTDLGLDWGMALSNLKAFIDAMLPYISGSTKWWLQPPTSGDGLILYVVDFAETDQTDLLPAPYEIDEDNPDWVTRIMPVKLGPVSWDWASNRDSAYIRGGTPPGEGSGWGFGIGGGRMGDAYIDAPGSITLDDRTAIAGWHQAQKFIAQLTAPAKMPAGWQDPYSGDLVTSLPWHVGQTTLVTSVRHSRLLGMIAGDRELDARPCVVQSVKGRLVTPSGGLAITIDGVTLDKRFEWKTLSFEEILGSAGKATVVIHLLDDTDELGVGLAADVWITVDDEAPADIEWDLTVGTLPPAGLSRELAKVQLEVRPAVQPVYHFKIEFDRNLPIGKTGPVKAQLCDAAEAPIPLSGVPAEWIILANDIDDNPLATTGWLADDTGTTDSGGAIFTTLTPGADASAIEISAVALPI